MHDQAEKLRSIVQQKNQTQLDGAQALSSRVITITSGKGGVGKTNLTINIAISLAKQNKRVIIIDADFGLANIEVLFGIIPKYNLAHVFNGQIEMEDAVTDGPLGIKFLSGGSGLRELANITERQMAFIIDKFTYLDAVADIILIDTGAGISDSVINFIKASSETIIITTPEPTSITDAYAIIKASNDNGFKLPVFKIVINRVDDFSEGNEVFDKISKVSKRFLDIDLLNLGFIPYDNNLIRAVKSQQPVLLSYPNSESSKAIDMITKRLLDASVPVEHGTGGIKGFIRKLSSIFK